jgi:hypothetical protein
MTLLLDRMLLIGQQSFQLELDSLFAAKCRALPRSTIARVSISIDPTIVHRQRRELTLFRMGLLRTAAPLSVVSSASCQMQQTSRQSSGLKHVERLAGRKGLTASLKLI